MTWGAVRTGDEGRPGPVSDLHDDCGLQLSRSGKLWCLNGFKPKTNTKPQLELSVHRST